MDFTIVVPTLNRPETLYFTLMTLIDQPGTDYEILVMDDSDNDQNQKVVLEINDPKIRYLKNKQRLGMRGNYEASIDEAKGKYITILGDDDAFVECGLQYAREIVDKTAPDVFYWWPHMYWWPTALLEHKASLFYVHKSVKEYKIQDAFELIENLYQNEENYFLFERLPSIYNGFVSKEHLKRLKKRVGHYFNDEIPDVYSGIANGVTSKKSVFIQWPLTIRGISGKSFGVAFRSKKGESIAKQFKSGMKENMCAPELINSRALAVHIASVKLRAMHTFREELSGFNVSVQNVIKGMFTELLESPDRYDELKGDILELAKKYNLNVNNFPNEFNNRITKTWGWNSDNVICINTEPLNISDIAEARILLKSLIGL